jgi:CheY-like chemotaxis protein
MPNRHKVLLLDDDEDLLELYREILQRLPSAPEIHVAASGARALALLESEPFTLLISDLNMPRMDGLQVLTIVRRKFPELRTAVMTSVVDEQFRARAYSMGVDLFLEKPNTQQEISFFVDCVESLLDQGQAGGFRGVQSKSLVDIIQLECLSRGSSVLKITKGGADARIWLQDGDIVDATLSDLSGEEAFRKILAWRTGSFEILPAEPDRLRTIHTSYQNLLLESAQAIDEAGARGETPAAEAQPGVSLASELARFPGVEFLLLIPAAAEGKPESWGVENTEGIAAWAKATLKRFRSVGENLQAGNLNRIDGNGLAVNVALTSRVEADLCVAFTKSLTPEVQRETLKKILTKWAS